MNEKKRAQSEQEFASSPLPAWHHSVLYSLHGTARKILCLIIWCKMHESGREDSVKSFTSFGACTEKDKVHLNAILCSISSFTLCTDVVELKRAQSEQEFASSPITFRTLPLFCKCNSRVNIQDPQIINSRVSTPKNDKRANYRE